MKKFLALIPLLLLCAACSTKTVTQSALPAKAAQSTSSLYNRQLQVGSTELHVQIANTAAEMEQGLSDRTSMASDQGMLFVFDRSTSAPFWMKDMDFGLDFIWINNGKIIGITPNVPAPQPNEKSDESKLQLYAPPSPDDEVLEVNAGWAKQNNITIGDVVSLK